MEELVFGFGDRFHHHFELFVVLMKLLVVFVFSLYFFLQLSDLLGVDLVSILFVSDGHSEILNHYLK